MKPRKSSEANLESRKGIFFKTGIIIAMVLVFMAFEYRKYERSAPVLNSPLAHQVDDEMIQITIPKPPEPPPVPPSQEIVVAPDDIEIEDVDIFIDVDNNSFENNWELNLDDFRVVEPVVDENIVFDRPEIMPEFPGGLSAMYEFLGRNIRYPRQAVANNIMGTVIVMFIVEKDGSITNVEVVRAIGGGCDEEAVRVINAMPRWNPGQMGIHPVRVKYTLPIVFRLSNR